MPTGPSKDGTYTNAKGGTELMSEGLYRRLDPALAEKIFIIKSRVRHLDLNKKNVLWLHDLWDDPENENLKYPEYRKQFSKIVFVSNYQFHTYNTAYGIGYNESVVLRNAIDRFEPVEKPEGRINLIYHTTPHRGLEILVPVFEELAKTFGDQIHLDVYSSFEAYGWKERDKPYQQLFERIKKHPNMTYHGFQPNSVVREALKKAHIFAYPSIWRETSCIAAIEAQAAGCFVLCPDLAALSETVETDLEASNWLYRYNENIQEHANKFIRCLHDVIHVMLYDNTGLRSRIKRDLKTNAFYINNKYSWDLRITEWEDMIKTITNDR